MMFFNKKFATISTSIYILLFSFAVAVPATAAIDFANMQPAVIGGKSMHVQNQAMESPACREFIRYATTEMNTFGLVAIQNGQPLLEMYDRGADHNSKFRVWSISKTLTGLMLGSLIKRSEHESIPLTLDTKVSELFDLGYDGYDAYTVSRNSLKVEHLLSFGSGIDWCEYPVCGGLDPIRILYSEARRNNLHYVLSKQFTHQPGARYGYNSGNYTLLQNVFRRYLRSEQEYARFPDRYLFGLLDIDNYTFERDGKDLLIGGAGASLTTRGMAKIGQVLVSGGYYGDRQIVSQDFFQKMTSLSQPLLSRFTPDEIRLWEGPTGHSLWLNKKIKGMPQWFPGLPEDMIYGGGKWGQFLLVFPSQQLVVARNGGDARFSDHWTAFANLAVRCFAPEAMVKPDPQRTKNQSLGAPSLYQYASSISAELYRGFLSNSFAQEYCTCRYVTGMKNMQRCRELVPMEPAVEDFFEVVHKGQKPKGGMTKILYVGVDYDDQKQQVTATTSDAYFGFRLGKTIARFTGDPKRGCEIVKFAKTMRQQRARSNAQ